MRFNARFYKKRFLPPYALIDSLIQNIIKLELSIIIK